jgi:hypothetical protein
MKIIGWEVDFIEGALPNINSENDYWSNEKIIYHIYTRNIIWYNIIKIETIKNELLEEINGEYMKSLFRFVDGSEKELYVNMKEIESLSVTDKDKDVGYRDSSNSKYKKRFDKIMKEVERDSND